MKSFPSFFLLLLNYPSSIRSGHVQNMKIWAVNTQMQDYRDHILCGGLRCGPSSWFAWTMSVEKRTTFSSESAPERPANRDFVFPFHFKGAVTNMTAATVMPSLQVAKRTQTSTSGHVKTRRPIVVCPTCAPHIPAVIRPVAYCSLEITPLPSQ